MDYIKEIGRAVDGIDTKIGEYARNADLKFRELSDEILQLKQRGAVRPGDIQTGAQGLTIGAKVWAELDKNADLLGKTGKLRLEIKAAADVTGTGSARSIMSGGVGVPAGLPIGVQFAMPTRPIGSTSAVEYSRYTGMEGAAALQAAEGDAKAAVRPTFSLISQTALTVAGYSKISKQALSDSVELQRAIDVTLQRSIATALDSLLNSGAWGGLLTLATAYTSLVYTGAADAASEGVATMQEAGFAPDTVVMRPADWLAITTAKAAGSGEYLSGSYLAPLGESLRGLRVVLSPSITAGKIMVMDSTQLELLTVEELTIEIGTDQDDFTKNVRTILGELRVVPAFRAVGAARLITPKA